MAEDFEESEIVFQETFEDQDSNEACNKFSDELRSKNPVKKEKLVMNMTNTKQKSATSSAAPVNIPEVSAWQLRFNMDHPDLDGGDDGEMVPPHVITGRRVARKMMSLSVCSGYGRTLKGRDMCQVRNSILRMTGFLET